VLRLWDSDFKDNVDGVVQQLKEWIETKRTHPLPKASLWENPLSQILIFSEREL